MNIENYKTALETEKEQLYADLKELGVESKTVTNDFTSTGEPGATNDADPNLVADRTEDWQERRATLALLETRYQNIVRALDKIAQGTFGVCEICQTAIAPERLEFNPAARTCQEHLDNEQELES